MTQRDFDDGSQAWMERQLKQRFMRGQGNGADVQYHGANHINLQEIDLNTVQDPVLRERLLAAKEAGLRAKENYSRSKHHGPAHLGFKAVDNTTASNYQMDVDINGFETAINGRMQTIRNENPRESFTTDEELARMPSSIRNRATEQLRQLQQSGSTLGQNNSGSRKMLGEVMNNNGNNGNSQFLPGQNQPQFNGNQSQQIKTCNLIEGHACYRAMQGVSGFGNSLVMARALGQIPSNIAMQQFVVKGLVNVYIVPPNQTTVDVAAIQTNPGRYLVQLVEVQGSPMSGLGTLLVSKEALGMPGGVGVNPSGGRQIITDSRTYHKSQQGQQIITGNNTQQSGFNALARTILKG